VLFEVDEVSFRYAGAARAALEGVSFRLAAGDCLWVVGRGGAGKSTLIQLLAGFLQPETGCLRVRGERSKVGVVFQFPEQQFFLPRVGEDVIYGLLEAGVSREKAEASAREALRWVGLDYERLRERAPEELSSGEQRRLAIACVLVMRPQFLLLDEPMAGLDYRARVEVWEWLRRLNRQAGVGLVVTAAGLSRVVPGFGRVLLLACGRCVWQGSWAELVRQPEVVEAAGLRLPALFELYAALRKRGCRYLPEPWKDVASACETLSKACVTCSRQDDFGLRKERRSYGE